MTKLLITYDTVDADGVRGETCYEVEVSNTVANVLLARENIDSRQKWVQYALEGLLCNAELLKDRRYVTDSIKDIRPAEKI